MKIIDGPWRGTARIICIAFLSALTGCSQYQMQGIVLEGAVSTIRIVDKDDPRLAEGFGIPTASIAVTLDPDRLSRKALQSTLSDVDGTFAVSVDEPGAGYLEYPARIVVQRAGYNTATLDLLIPGPDQRLLVTLVSGEDKYKPQPPDLMEETLKMGEPYMQ
jgi:hypothetical protein